MRLIALVVVLAGAVGAQPLPDQPPPQPPPQSEMMRLVPIKWNNKVPTRFRFDGIVPEGYHLESQPRMGLVISGAVTAGLTWALTAGLSLSFAGTTRNTGWSAIPFTGAFVQAALTPQGGANSFLQFLLITSGLVQMVGGLLIELGFSSATEWLEKDRATPAPISVRVGPTGLALVF